MPPEAYRWEGVAAVTTMVYLPQLIMIFFIPILLRAPDYGLGATVALIVLDAAVIFPAIYRNPRKAYRRRHLYISASAAAVALSSLLTPLRFEAEVPPFPTAFIAQFLVIASITSAFFSRIKPKAVIGLYATYWLGLIGMFLSVVVLISA